VTDMDRTVGVGQRRSNGGAFEVLLHTYILYYGFRGTKVRISVGNAKLVRLFRVLRA
jgi:hypothetical protein